MRTTISALILFALPLACGDSDAADTDTDAATDTTAAGSSSSGGEPTSSTGEPGVDPAALYKCKEEMFGASPLSGPLWDAEKGGIQGALQANYVLHTTQIYIRPENAAMFGELAQAVGAAAAQTEGLIAFSVGDDIGCGVARTMGIWASEEAMYKLVTSDAHNKAMAATLDVSYTGRVTHWTATAAEANAYTWDVARAKIADVAPSGLY
jgi:heme-degrading monooxygenase HmoA